MNNSQGGLMTRRFVPLFVCQFLGAFNDNAFKNGLLVWVTFDMAARHDLNAPLTVTLATGLFVLPFFLVSGIAGELAERSEKSILIERIKLGECAIMCIAALGFWFEAVYGLVALLCLMGAQSTFFGPVKYSLLPQHVDQQNLARANGLISGATFLAILLGTILGAMLVTRQNGTLILSGCLILLAFAGWGVSRVIPAAPATNPGGAVNRNLLRGTIGIVREGRTTAAIWRGILLISWFWLLGATFLTQLVTYAKEILGGSEAVVTLFLTAFSVGVAAGSLAAHMSMRLIGTGRTVTLGIVGMSAGISVLVVTSRLGWSQPAAATGNDVMTVLEFIARTWPALGVTGGLLLLAFSGGMFVVPLYTDLQRETPPASLSRVIAANNVMNAAFMVGGSIMLVLMFQAGLSVLDAFLVLGALNLGALLVTGSKYSRPLQ